jgi:hypothetical protein
MMVKVKTWTRAGFLANDFDVDEYGRVSDGHYFIGRDVVSGYALIDGNIMEDVYDRLNRSDEQYDVVVEYRF